MLAGFGNWDKVMSGEERLEGRSVFSNGDGTGIEMRLKKVVCYRTESVKRGWI